MSSDCKEFSSWNSSTFPPGSLEADRPTREKERSLLSYSSCCSCFFLSSTTGAANPRGSYTELTVARTPRRVNGLSGRLAVYVKASISESQYNLSDR